MFHGDETARSKIVRLSPQGGTSPESFPPTDSAEDLSPLVANPAVCFHQRSLLFCPVSFAFGLPRMIWRHFSRQDAL